MSFVSPKPRSVLSLDVGRRRVGLAGCDPLGLTVSRLPALHRKSFQADIELLKLHCQNRKIEGLIVGLPIDSQCRLTRQAEHCRRYGQRIAKELNLPLAWVNEHSSSWYANQTLNIPKDKSGQLDSAVAALLLEQWLKEGPDLKPVKMAAHLISKVE